MVGCSTINHSLSAYCGCLIFCFVFIIKIGLLPHSCHCTFLVFISQIAGAMTKKGKSLTDIVQTVRMVLNVLATYGVSLSACSVPGVYLLCTTH
jgi:hypothetical protein